MIMASAATAPIPTGPAGMAALVMKTKVTCVPPVDSTIMAVAVTGAGQVGQAQVQVMVTAMVMVADVHG